MAMIQFETPLQFVAHSEQEFTRIVTRQNATVNHSAPACTEFDITPDDKVRNIPCSRHLAKYLV